MKKIKQMKALVTEVKIEHNRKIMMIKTEEGQEEILLLNENVTILETEFFKEKPLEYVSVGSKVSVYTSESTPVAMSMPPQYTPLLIVVAQNENDLLQKASYFDDNLISLDRTVRINEATFDLIATLDNKNVVKEMLKNRYLIVFYQRATRSIPAIITPIKIIVL